MSEEKDDIEKILSDYKERRDNSEREPILPLEPPKRREDYIDFSKPDEEEESNKKPKKPKKTPEELEKIKALKKEKAEKTKEKSKAILKKIKKGLFNKRNLIILISLAVVVTGIFGIKYAVEQSKSAYLKPYQQKYPDAEFQVGMLEKYCDKFGQNPNTVGFLEIPDIELRTAVSSDKNTFPNAQGCTKGAEQFNYVVYLDDNSLESIYSSAQAYNNSSGYMLYSDLFNEYSFKVVGAFYTNTKAEDDGGYIFPYNVTEKMTVDSMADFISKLESRFIYTTGVNVTRQDTLLTISCPTDYREDFRFVVVGVLRDDADSKWTATEKSKIHYQQVIYDEMGIDNPYRFASKWYPEIIVTDKEGNEKTIQKSIEDYK
ncbi:MAG: hypothetical protein J1E36_00175 [Eubacterium sp.]|nr:hypothetical protein [Eubacterium sp.]